MREVRLVQSGRKDGVVVGTQVQLPPLPPRCSLAGSEVAACTQPGGAGLTSCSARRAGISWRSGTRPLEQAAGAAIPTLCR